MANTIFHLVSVIVLINVEYVYADNYVRACFFNSSARFRTTEARFSVPDIDFSLCTHYIYNYARIDVQGETIVAADPAVEEGTGGLYQQFASGQKLNNPNMKTLLSVGGPGNAIDALFEALHSRDSSFNTFGMNAIGYVYQYGFNGINIHWEARNDVRGKTHLPQLLKKLAQHAQASSSLVTMTGFGSSSYIQRYNLSEIQKHVHYLFVNCHDMVSPSVASFIGPLFMNFHNPVSAINMNYIIDFYRSYGMPLNKLVMMVSALGHYVQLTYPGSTAPGSAASSVVLRGQKYLLDNRLAYPEVVPTSTKYFDYVESGPYLVKGSEWIGYMDTVSLSARMQYLRQRGMAGIAFSNLDEDDFRGTACNAGRFPLVAYIKQQLEPVTTATVPPTTAISTTANATSATATSMGQATTEMYTNDTSPTTIESDNVSTTTPRTPDIRETNEAATGIFKYVLLIFCFAIGYISGHLFMWLARRICSNYSKNNSSPATDIKSPGTDKKSPATDIKSPATDIKSPGTDKKSPITDVSKNGSNLKT